MRKLTSHLFISLDGVVEAPDRFLRDDLYQDLSLFDEETVTGQDAVLLGRRTYEAWAMFWPGAEIEPFASFINQVPKYVVSGSLRPSTGRRRGCFPATSSTRSRRSSARPGRRSASTAASAWYRPCWRPDCLTS